MTTRRGFLGATAALALIGKPKLKHAPVSTFPVTEDLPSGCAPGCADHAHRKFLKMPVNHPVQAGEVVVYDGYGIRPATASDLYSGPHTFYGIAAENGFYADEVKVLVRNNREAVLP